MWTLDKKDKNSKFYPNTETKTITKVKLEFRVIVPNV